MEDKVYFTIFKVEEKIKKTNTEMAREVLKKMLDYFNLEFKKIFYLENGKAYFENSKIFFNYSHCENFIACSISYFEVGIDIEKKGREISDKISFRFLENEKNMEKRLEKWVKKEAYSKMKGLGFQIGFKNVILENLKEKNIFIDRDEYICSVFSENKNAIFEELFF